MKESKYSITFIVACVMLSLLLVVGFTSANWLTNATGNSNARVAVYAVSGQAVSGTDLTINCNENNNEATYQFVVSNQKDNAVCQVNVGYSVKITLTETLPQGMTITIDGEYGTKSSDGLTYTFTDSAWEFTAGIAEENQHTVAFTADPDVVQKNYSFVDIKISILTEQKN